MKLVIAHENGRDVAIDSDGARHDRPEQGELMDEPTARRVSAEHGGQVVDESRIFPDIEDD
jgi:hypothetical protein